MPQIAPNPISSSGSAGDASQPSSPGRAAVTFLLCAVYFTATLAVVSFVTRVLDALRPGGAGQMLSPVLSLLLLTAGLMAISRARVPQLRPLSAIGLVVRPSARREAALGAVVGWSIPVALILPWVLTLHMQSTVTLDGVHFGATTASFLLLILFVLGRQLVLCGLPFRSLTQATSPLFATVAFGGVAALLTLSSAHGDAAQAVLAAMAQVVFCMAALRTRAIWMSAALQFVWGFATTILFGLPSFLWPAASGIVASSLRGPRWLTGGVFGPEAAMWAGLVLLAALVAVWRLTRDYAWHYTFDPIVGGGYPMDVSPPAEHTRMEQQASSAPTLVQIGGLPSVSPAHTPMDEDLRENRS